MKLSCTRIRSIVLVLSAGFVFAAAAVDAEVLINEVIADNQSTDPEDIGGGTPDMIELYNDSDEAVVLGAATAAASYHLSDGCRDGSDPVDPDDCPFPGLGSDMEMDGAWGFPEGTVIEPRGFLVVFCDGSETDGLCELHASFEIASNGAESIVLWAPEDAGGQRAVADRVWLPPLDPDVSFARSTDGAGGANVPLAEVLDFFVHSRGSFGECDEIPGGSCGNDGQSPRICRGATNTGRTQVSPKLNFPVRLPAQAGGGLAYSSNHPLADEPVVLSIEVRDEEAPTPAHVTVQLLYTVNGGGAQTVSMDFVQQFDQGDEGRPLSIFAVWRGEIPGLPAGSDVEFTFFATDIAGAVNTIEPDEPCSEDGVEGPCNELGLPGPGCKEDDKDPERLFEDCNAPYRYRVGHAPREELTKLVINEIVPLQDGLLEDVSRLNENGNPDPDDNEDFIELYNGSDSEIDLGGLWLSDRPFEPRGSPFPAGATIASGEYLIVWIDDDGYRCPRIDEYDSSDPDEPQQCPDPTDASKGEYHTNFRLDADGEQIYLFDRLEDGLGLIHGYEFASITENKSWALCPDGDPSGTFVVQAGSPRASNTCPLVDAVFRRGDVNGDCNVNITDPVFLLASLFQGGGETPPCLDAADSNDDGTLNISDPVFVLNYLFASGSAPNAPGPDASGPDPTDDELSCAASNPCR